MEGASGHANPQIDVSSAVRRIADLARPSLDRRLTRNTTAPLVIAFSGGGDSLALLIAARAWAGAAGRRLVAVTVDHRLQAAGAAWASACQALCHGLGVDHLTLAWTGDKPAAGLAAAARQARHVLIAQAARAAGARVIAMGHTADDRLEARLMRAAGGSVTEPREWSPSPVWPEGREIFILRPLIEAQRADIRDALIAAGQTWIEDPANADPRSPRARARAALLLPRPLTGEVARDALSHRVTEGAGAAHGEAGKSLGRGVSSAAPMLQHLAEGPAGDLAMRREVFRQAPPAARRALVGAALLCVAGTARPPRGERLDRLVAALAEEAPFVATLAGARVEAGATLIRIARETGDARRAGAGVTPLAIGVPTVWDGRFEIEARAPGLSVGPLAGLAGRLDGASRQALRAVPAAARRGLPAVTDTAGRVTAPSLIADPRAALRSLVFPRLAAALGGVQSEAAIGRVAECLATS